MDFLALVHEVGKIAKPMHQDSLEKPDWDSPFNELGFDSLDMLMVACICATYTGCQKRLARPCRSQIAPN